MFSGIIEKTAEVNSVVRSGDSSIIRMQTGFSDLVLGESVAVNGVCLTVTDEGAEALKSGEVAFFVSSETLARTSLENAVPGFLVNLERAMQLGQRISGHIVQGHVDGKAVCTKLEEQSGGSWLLEFRLPSDLAKYTVEKGSIALDGVSLTINSIFDSHLRIMLIPHTWTHTRFSRMACSEPVQSRAHRDQGAFGHLS